MHAQITDFCVKIKASQILHDTPPLPSYADDRHFVSLWDLVVAIAATKVFHWISMKRLCHQSSTRGMLQMKKIEISLQTVEI